ncbi:MAG: radical SAM protein [Desulfurococcaceae archaeon]
MSKLRVLRDFDPWRSPLCTCPLKYSLHPYTGCSHLCLYCYASSYIGVKESYPKNRFLENLARDLTRIRQGTLVELSTSSDPYPPIEEKLGLTRRTLKLLSRRGVKILITTKSDLVTRDVDLLLKASSAVMITITTLDEKIAKAIEPGAPSPQKRLNALRELRKQGIPVGVRLDPIIPFVNDDYYAIEELVGRVVEAGAMHIVTSTYKARWSTLKRIAEGIPEVARKVYRLYGELGSLVHGYLYLPRSTRRLLLQLVIEPAKKYNLTYATCREGLGSGFFNAPTCDGSHLIDLSRQGAM